MRSYWLDLFTVETWQEFLDAGAKVSGFSEVRWKAVSQMRVGDYLLCYLVGRISRWVGVLEVTSEGFIDQAPIWRSRIYPARVRVRPVVKLTPETGVPVLDMREQLSVFRNLRNPNIWSGHFRGSPYKWKAKDGEAVLAAVTAAHADPVRRPLAKDRGQRRPILLESGIGQITFPESDQPDGPISTEAGGKEPTVHTEIQWLLLKLGVDMGNDVWVARNDRGRTWDGHSFADLPKLRSTLPQQFDDLTNSIVSLIDVLWIKSNAIVAAFEIESTTSIYSGLLRMTDLLALQPNVAIPLFLVAPDDRRSKVISEINRPTFARLPTPLVDVCRFISFNDLRIAIADTSRYVHSLKPDLFLQDISEDCGGESAE